MKKQFDVVTALDVCMDLLVNLGTRIPQFGQKEQMVEDFHISLGGSAGIFASQCAKLGLKTAGIGTTGDDLLGRMFYQEFACTGVCMEAVRIDKREKTGVGIALNQANGDRAILTYTGTIGKINQQDFYKFASDTKHLHIASWYLLKRIQKTYFDILPELKRQDVTVSLDTNWDPEERWGDGLEQLFPYVDILFANEQELLAISKENTLDKTVEKMQQKIPLVVLKMGERGARAYECGREYKVVGEPKIPVDTVGAGDSFDAGFVYGFLHGKSVEECMKIGCFCGGESVTEPGGIKGQPVLEEVERQFIK